MKMSGSNRRSSERRALKCGQFCRPRPAAGPPCRFTGPGKLRPQPPTSSLPPVLASLALPGPHTSSYLTPEPQSGPMFPTEAEKALTKGSAE